MQTHHDSSLSAPAAQAEGWTVVPGTLPEIATASRFGLGAPIATAQAAADMLDALRLELQTIIREAQDALRLVQIARDRLENLPLWVAA